MTHYEKKKMEGKARYKAMLTAKRDRLLARFAECEKRGLSRAYDDLSINAAIVGQRISTDRE